MYIVIRHLQIIFHLIDVLRPLGIKHHIVSELRLINKIKFFAVCARRIGVPAVKRITLACWYNRLCHFTVHGRTCGIFVLLCPYQIRRHGRAALTVKSHPVHIVGPMKAFVP